DLGMPILVEAGNSAVEPPGALGLLLDRLAGLPDQLPGEGLGQAVAGLTIAAGLGGHGIPPAIGAVFLQAVHGFGAALVLGEDLGEEEAQGDPWDRDAIAPARVAVARDVREEAGTVGGPMILQR